MPWHVADTYRYMARKYNAALGMANMASPHQWSSNDGEDPPEWRVVEVFTDYEGDEPYGDFVETDSTSVPPTETASYEPGLWRKDLVSGVAEYLHNDHLGTLRVTSPSGVTGGLGAQRAYTAFGEVVAGPTDRFGYVGAHGYQAHDGVPFLHVGARYYDPSSGRFLQRDPVGIRGGLNTYSYVTNVPTTGIDIDGLWRSEMIPDRPIFEQKRREELERLERNPPSPQEELEMLQRRIKWLKRGLKVMFCILGGGIGGAKGGFIAGGGVEAVDAL